VALLTLLQVYRLLFNWLKMNREEFEKKSSLKLHRAITKAKKIRHHLRQLEQEIINKQNKIDNYQQIFMDLQNQLVKIQAIIYSKGST